jgi:hypothetical protein
MNALPIEPPVSFESIATAITRRVDSYIEMVDRARTEKSLRTEEERLLDHFERYTADILDRYSPPGRRHRESLVFAKLYAAWDARLPDDERRRALITALMAAEVESRGPLRLTRAQNGRLAGIFERIGMECRKEQLLRHAELAFDRAAGTYLMLGDNSARDRCLFARSRSKQTALGPGLAKAQLALSWILCGYGYKPWRLLLWVLVELVVFTAGIAVTSPGSVGQSIHTSLTNYLDPGDADGLPGTAQLLLVLESYIGLVSLSVFFALLVHRWFRI